MTCKRSSLGWWTLLVAMAAPALMVAGCRERHLVGEGPADASAGSPDAGTQGSGDARGPTPNGTADGGTGGAGAATLPGDGGPAGADGSMPTTDATPGGATVVSLGDKASGGWAITITPEEVARRLSQFLMRKPPSASLTAAVVASAPKTNQDVGQLTEGLLLQDATLAGRQAFYRWWLGLDAFATVARDPALFPLFSSDVRLALIDQTLAFVEDITWRPQGDLSTLLTEPAAFVTNATAPWFPGAVVPAGTAATRVILDATQYAGIVTQPAVVATADRSNRTEPSGRGLEVRRRYLCQPIPSEPPRGVASPLPPGQTVRQWLEDSVGSEAGCSVCHKLVDPLGFAFGHFDAVGAFQDTEGGLPVDTSGVLIPWSGGSGLAFAGAPGLANHLAQLPEVRLCFAAQWLAFASGKYPDPTFAQAATGMDGTLAVDADYVVRRATIQGRLHLRGTIRAVTETHGFLDP